MAPKSLRLSGLKDPSSGVIEAFNDVVPAVWSLTRQNFEVPSFGTVKHGWATIPGKRFLPNNLEYLPKFLSRSLCDQRNSQVASSKSSSCWQLSSPFGSTCNLSASADGQHPDSKPRTMESVNL